MWYMVTISQILGIIKSAWYMMQNSPLLYKLYTASWSVFPFHTYTLKAIG